MNEFSRLMFALGAFCTHFGERHENEGLLNSLMSMDFNEIS